MNQSGMLPLIYAHLMSLALIRDVFFRQVDQGKGPVDKRSAEVEAPKPSGKKGAKAGANAEA